LSDSLELRGTLTRAGGRVRLVMDAIPQMKFEGKTEAAAFRALTEWLRGRSGEALAGVFTTRASEGAPPSREDDATALSDKA
jgi:hypothetical protein